MSCNAQCTLVLRNSAGVINALNYSGHAFYVTDLQTYLERLKAATGCQFVDDALRKACRIARIVNNRAYRERYKHKDDCRYVSPFYEGPINSAIRHAPFDSYEAAKSTLFKTIKSLHFLEYNCIDIGDELRNGKYAQFFELLKELIDTMSLLAILNSPEYRAAKWE